MLWLHSWSGLLHLKLTLRLSSPPHWLRSAPQISRSLNCLQWWIEGDCSCGCHHGRRHMIGGVVKCFLCRSGQNCKSKWRWPIALWLYLFFSQMMFGLWVPLARSSESTAYQVRHFYQSLPRTLFLQKHNFPFSDHNISTNNNCIEEQNKQHQN